ncbi:hypothetical protein V9T40_009949 [Parthenolecanium corni]|uniref:G2/mitotic-specific cyclin-B3 n=1 Tax=Parthenolecanium corni TaxID=536013 RepID=A0AAN9Y557_9HEMI
MAPINNRSNSSRVIASARKPTISAENVIAGSSISFSKRKADSSPAKNGDFKRLALNEITNDGKTAKVKSILQNGKSNKSNIDISVNKLTFKSNVSVPETRSRSTKLVSGVRIQGPFKGRSNVNPQLHQNGSLLKNNGDLKPKTLAKPQPRPSIITRASLSSRSSIEKPAKSVGNSSKKVDGKVGKANHNSSVTNAENLKVFEPAVLLSKLKLRSSTTHSTFQDGNVDEEPPIRRSLRNHIEKNEISVQSLIPMFESKRENLPLSESENIKLRRSLRLAAIAEKTEISSQIVDENQISEIGRERSDPSPVKLRRSLRNNALKTDSTADQSHVHENDAEKYPKSELVVKLKRSLPNDAEKNEASFQVYVENQSSDGEPKVLRRSSRLSLRKSLPSDKSTENGSLYISALEDVNTSFREQENDRRLKHYSQLSEFDKELLHDPQQVSLYAMEIFDYLKSRESHFPILDYMHRQPHIDRRMRAMLVDWLVEVQENFELNHETLYLSIKLLDSYLSHNEVRRESLQLLGAAALFLSCKYDERLSPLTDEFEYVGDGAYDKSLLLTMEQNILRCVNYELSFPISYSFLRRYARCARIQMPLLTLARYILELGLMDYDTITLSDSKQAAAALYLAFRMTRHSTWTDSLRFYTGYDVEDFKDIVLLFNRILHQKPSSTLSTIRNKYSHELFFEVARTPLLSNRDLNLDD